MGRQHELSFGTSYRKDVFDQWGGGGAGGIIDPYNPTNDFPKVDVDMSAWNYRNTAVEKSVYGVARFNPIDPLHVILGARVMWYDWNDRAGSTDYNVTQKVTPYAGVIYDLNDTYSVYASYTQIFKPQSGQTESGSALDPMTGENYEIGLKGEYLNGALNASVALFDMTQEKRAYSTETRCGIVFCSATAGEVRSQGIDTELTGALTSNWQFTSSYTYVYSQYTKDPTNEGKLFAPEQPKHLFKTATTYNFTGDLNKLRIGADVYAQSKTFREVGNGSANQDAYAVVGLMAGYKFDENWDGRVNVNNLFDEKYWQGIPTAFGGGVYGDPRNLMFSLKWTL
jgi:outer membrane receptor for ferric coprogen and ferric-rhodotorulic acid